MHELRSDKPAHPVREEGQLKSNRGLMRAWRAIDYSLSGFSFAVREESSFRQELVLAAIMVPAAFFLQVTPLERLLLIGSVALVLIVELLNSAVEAAIDRISMETHSLSKRAKDFGSAAVMLALLLCGATWITLLWPLVAVWWGGR
jgi:diacylglycerol kinase (ATP)